MSERTPREPASVTVEDLRRTRRLSAALLVLAGNATADELATLGITPAEVVELRAAVEAADRAIPTARNTVLATFGGHLSKEMVLTGYARAQRALHSLAPLVVLRMAEKVDDDQAPGSTRLLIELAKGLGLLTPAEPVSAANRTALLDLDGERAKPIDVLKDEILRHSA